MRITISILAAPVFIFLSSFIQLKQAATVKGKMYFSNKPFTNNNSGNKNSFTSADYIYGRFELDEETIDKAFRVTENQGKNDHAHFLYRVYIFYKGEEVGFNSSGNICLVRPKEKTNRWFNFDVLAEPAKATTVMAGTRRFEYYTLGTAPLYGLIRPEKFEENGEYKILVKFYSETYDSWSNLESVENWPVLQDEFTFKFDVKDVPTLLKNKEVADDVIEKNAFINK